jgi:LPPG:FO 2-phospho-L-lactate transferase
MITTLAGGVGAARFLEGLVKVMKANDIAVIVNTADDIELFGLHISPDPDIILYTLSGLVDPQKGWGITEDSFNCLSMLENYGHDTWFNLGDKDLATHIERTFLLRKGFTLSQVIGKFSERLGLNVKLLPMTNEQVQTKIITKIGKMHFQEYLVKRLAQDQVLSVKFEGISEAYPAPAVISSIKNSEFIIICPSNPIVSIGPILSVNGIRTALKKTNAKIAAISPIIRGKTIKGPADKLMEGLGIEVSAFGVAELYSDFIDLMVIDDFDDKLKPNIESIGIKCITTNTIMNSISNKNNLAKDVIDALKNLK